MIGYLALTGIFFAMILACFGFAISELVRPSDPGPLPIDVKRDIDHRFFAKLLRTQGPYEVMGDGGVVPDGYVSSFVCDGVASIGENAVVTSHAEGRVELVLAAGASVLGRATSEKRIVLGPASMVYSAAAPIIRTSALPAAKRPPRIEPWDPQLDTDLEWLLSLRTPVDVAIADIELTAGGIIDAREAVLRYERQTLRPVKVLDIHDVMTPAWIGSMRGWYLGAATVRLRGDVELPQDSIVPYNLIVEGNLLANAGVRFAGSVHAAGDAVLGDECLVAGSVTAGRHVVIGDNAVVHECVSSRVDSFIGSRAWIGGDRDGGLAAGGSAQIGFGTVIRHRVYAEAGARVQSFATESVLAGSISSPATI